MPYIGKHRKCPKCEIPAILKRLVKNCTLQEIVLNLAKFKDWAPLTSSEPPEESLQESSNKPGEDTLAKLLFTPTQGAASQNGSTNSHLVTPEAAPDKTIQTPSTQSPKSGVFKTPIVFTKNIDVTRKSTTANKKADVINQNKAKKRKILHAKSTGKVKEGPDMATSRSTNSRHPEAKLDSRSKWPCSRCTFLNLTRAKKCGMCLAPRDAAPLQTTETNNITFQPEPMPTIPALATCGVKRRNKHKAELKAPTTFERIITSPIIIAPKEAEAKQRSVDSKPVIKGPQQYFVALTGFVPQQKKGLSQLFKDLNHAGLKVKEIEKSIDFHKATHLVTCFASTQGKEANVCSRTIKYVHGLVFNIPVLEQSWLIDSLKRKKWQSIDGYLLNGTTSYGPLERVVAPIPNLSVKSLFTSYNFYLKGFSASSVPTKVEILGIIKAAGGKVISNIPLVKEVPARDIKNIVSPYSFTLHTSALGRKYIVPNISTGEKVPMEASPSRYYSLCTSKHAIFSDAKGSTNCIRMPFPSDICPLVITVDKGNTDMFPPAPESLHDQSAPHSWILDCISARMILPLPYAMQK
ncbi:hypothetical protein DSO57_1034404 [Entomophthora muscae]|uniref:Uncharacterized protein n=1 Tax=Entomophthora muscae TaxID=34485 RepID=A0ACC2TYJ2_9FUNG|nr:hypothetical protein DSO57_1034404 [Entomophthora muscae]